MQTVWTPDSCRAAFRDAGLTYSGITEPDLHALQGYIAIRCADRAKTDRKAPFYTMPRRKDDSLCAKFDDGGKLVKAYLKIDCPGEWSGREAVSFNPDGFIGFCGWADTQNSQPILSAFMEWLCEFVIPTRTEA